MNIHLGWTRQVILLKSTDSNSWNERHFVHWVCMMLPACLNIMHTLWWCYVSMWIWILHTYIILGFMKWKSLFYFARLIFFYIKVSWKTVLIHWLSLFHQLVINRTHMCWIADCMHLIGEIEKNVLTYILWKLCSSASFGTGYSRHSSLKNLNFWKFMMMWRMSECVM